MAEDNIGNPFLDQDFYPKPDTLIDDVSEKTDLPVNTPPATVIKETTQITISPVGLLLAGLGDVLLGVCADGDNLVYNSAIKKWINESVTLVKYLGDLLDLWISSPADGEVLTYDAGSSRWKNKALPTPPVGVPSGLIALFNCSCPAGWTRVSALDNKFPMGAGSYGATGGGGHHKHDIPTMATGANSVKHHHAVPVGSVTIDALVGITTVVGAAGTVDSGDESADHTHTVPASTYQTADEATAPVPPYLAVVFCSKD